MTTTVVAEDVILPSRIGQISPFVREKSAEAEESPLTFFTWLKETILSCKDTNLTKCWEQTVSSGCISKAKTEATKRTGKIQLMVALRLVVIKEENHPWPDVSLKTLIDPEMSNVEIFAEARRLNNELWQSPAFNTFLNQTAATTARINGHLACLNIIDVCVVVVVAESNKRTL